MRPLFFMLILFALSPKLSVALAPPPIDVDRIHLVVSYEDGKMNIQEEKGPNASQWFAGLAAVFSWAFWWYWYGRRLKITKSTMRPPQPGEPCRMTVNFEAQNGVIVAWEVYWDRANKKWMVTAHDQVLEANGPPNAQDPRFRIYPTEWQE